MDRHNQIPIRIFHVLEADIAENTGIIEQHVDPTEALDGSLDDLVAILDTVVVRNGFAAGVLDLFDDDVRCLWMWVSTRDRPKHVIFNYLCSCSFTFEGAAQVVDDHIGASGSEEQSIRFP